MSIDTASFRLLCFLGSINYVSEFFPQFSLPVYYLHFRSGFLLLFFPSFQTFYSLGFPIILHIENLSYFSLQVSVLYSPQS